MLCNYFSEKMLGLQDAIVRNVENTDQGVLIQIRMERKAHKCPACGNETDQVHDYRKQEIKDLPLFGYFFKICVKSKEWYKKQSGYRVCEA